MRPLPLLPPVSRLTVEYVRVIVEGWVNGSQVNPTTFGVQFAFTDVVPGAAEETWPLPTENDWVTGSWETSNKTYMARGLFGPGTAAALAPGDHVVWCRVISNPEEPVRRLAILRIT